MKLAILGGTGQTGRLLIEQALAAGHSVVALARRPEAITTTHAQLTVAQGDGTTQADVGRALVGVDAVLVAVGPPSLKASTLRTDVARATVAAMKQHGVKKLVWLSAFGVGDSLPWAKRTSLVLRLLLRFLLRTTYVDANGAEDAIRASELEYVLLRPPQLTNGAARGSFDVVTEGSKLPRMRISRADTAAFMLQAAQSHAFDRTNPVVC